MKKLSVALLSAVALTSVASSVITAGADTTSTKSVTPSKLSTRILSTFTSGTLTTSGSIINNGGLTIDSDSKTNGILELTYTVANAGSVNLGDQTYTYFTVPEEFYDLMDATDLTKYISGAFTFKTLGGQTVKPYSTSDISIVGNHMIRVNNGKNAGIIEQSGKSVIDINLGKAVTESKVRIPNADTAYTFHATTSTDNSFVNWVLVGNSDSWTSLANIPKLDPGYGYRDNIPVVNDIYDTDKVVKGTATPGSKISVYNGSGTLIGSGTTLSDGSYVVKIGTQYLPLEEYDEIDVTQNTGLGESKAAITLVKHLG